MSEGCEVVPCAEKGSWEGTEIVTAIYAFMLILLYRQGYFAVIETFLAC